MDLAPPTEVVIVSARLPEAPGEQVFSTSAVDPAAIEDAVRLDDAVRSVPGVSLFRRSGSGSANPTIQGLSIRAGTPSGAGRVLVTLDGAPQNDPFGGWVLWGGLPPETIADATIIRGAGAGPYGAGALTGVVALEERTARGGALSFEAGERGGLRASGVGIADDGNLNFMLAAAAEHQDGWIPIREGRGAADSPLWLDAMSGAARLQAQHGDVVMAARVSGYAETRGSGLVDGESTASGASASLTLVSQPAARGMGWRLQAWARSSDMANDFFAVAADRNTATPASEQYETPAYGWGLNAAARWMLDAGGVEIGADVRGADGETHERFRFMGGEYTRGRIAGGETLIVGAYVEAWRESGPWLFAGGARLDSWQAFDGVRRETDLANNAIVLDATPDDGDALAPTARVGVRRSFGEASYLRSALYAGFRPPTLNELHRPFRVGNDVTEANAQLEPEYLYGFDAGIGGERSGIDWDLGLFITRLEDPVTNVTRGVGPGTFPPGVFVPAGGAYRVRENAGRIDSAGVEARAGGAVSETLTWRTALNYTHARVDGGDSAPQLTDLRPAQSPAWSVTAGLAWRPVERAELSADVTHESDRFEDDLNTRTLDAATRLDLRFSYRITEPLAVFVALDNATDEAVSTAVTADGIYSYDAPRTVRAGFRIALD